MGQHKHNPTAIAAAKGNLPPKPKKLSKRERDRRIVAEMEKMIYAPMIKAAIRMQEEEHETDL